MESKIEFAKADKSSFDGTNADRYSADESALFSQQDAKPNVGGSCEFHAGQKVTFMCAVWDEETKSVKEVETPATIQYSYNFKQTARLHYFDPFDGQIVYRELEFSKLKAVNA